MSFGISKTKPLGPQLLQLDENRHAFAVDGIIRYVGSYEDCQARWRIASQGSTRVAQDERLHRAVLVA